MKLLKTAKIFYKDRLAAILLNITILVILATWLLFIFYKAAPDPLTALHYNIYAGIDTLGSWRWLYIIPGIVLAISIIDVILAVLFWTKQRMWSYFLLITILLINAGVFYYLYNILNYNF
ncbi:MAG: hypothetical protein HOO10_11120 [Candidatus Marinimicrobia bacterium]|jgi:hypothetical protein|nr:hypothetical protein [Candidatus Neomarinimicrobiota bacterium]